MRAADFEEMQGCGGAQVPALRFFSAQKQSGRGKTLPYEFCLRAEKENGRFVNRPYTMYFLFSYQIKAFALIWKGEPGKRMRSRQARLRLAWLRSGVRPVGRYPAMTCTFTTPRVARSAVRNASIVTRMCSVSAVIVTGATPLDGML